VVVAAAYGLMRIFAINSVVVSSPGRGEEIKVEVQKLIGNTWTQGNLLTFNNGDLESKLQQEDPLLRSVTVRRQWMHTIRVTAVLRQPSLGWSTDNQSFLLDRDGTAIGPLPPGSALPVVSDGSNLPVKVGDRVTTSRFVAFVVALTPALTTSGFPVTGLSIKDTTLDLTVGTAKGYRLVFDTSRTVGEELADLKAVQGVMVAQGRVPSEYIDLRIAGKAYYK
jgi:cell division septal protein FtsQ